MSIDEFLRNREHILQHIKKSVKEMCVTHYQTSIIKEEDEMKEMNVIRDRIKELSSLLANKVNKYIVEPDNDPVYKNVVRLHENPIEYSNDLISKAHARKLIGNPPTTDKKKTICDELHWEILLANANDDLIIVSRDDGFLSNTSFLENEYYTVTGSKLIITPKLTDAMTMVGATPSPELKRVDEVTVKIEYGYVPPGAQLITLAGP